MVKKGHSSLSVMTTASILSFFGGKMREISTVFHAHSLQQVINTLLLCTSTNVCRRIAFRRNVYPLPLTCFAIHSSPNNSWKRLSSKTNTCCSKNGARCTRLRCSTCSSHRSKLRKTGADQSIASSLLNDICMSEHIILRAFLLSVMEDIFGKKKFEKKTLFNVAFETGDSNDLNDNTNNLEDANVKVTKNAFDCNVFHFLAIQNQCIDAKNVFCEKRIFNKWKRYKKSKKKKLNFFVGSRRRRTVVDENEAISVCKHLLSDQRMDSMYTKPETVDSHALFSFAATPRCWCLCLGAFPKPLFARCWNPSVNDRTPNALLLKKTVLNWDKCALKAHAGCFIAHFRSTGVDQKYRRLHDNEHCFNERRRHHSHGLAQLEGCQSAETGLICTK